MDIVEIVELARDEFDSYNSVMICADNTATDRLDAVDRADRDERE